MTGYQWEIPTTRVLVEQAIARGHESTFWLMNAFGLTYEQVQAIKSRMADTTVVRPARKRYRRCGEPKEVA